MNLRYALKRFNEIPYLNLRERLFSSKLCNTLVSDRFINRLVTGYPIVLENSAGHPLIDYKIYGNIFQNSVTVTENVKLLDSSNAVIFDSEGNEIRTSEVVTYESPSPEHPAEVLGCGDRTDIGYEIPVVSRTEDGTTSLTTPIYLSQPLYKDDYVVKDKSGGKVHRAWGVKVFDGTEEWRLWSLDTETIERFYCRGYVAVDGALKDSALCSHFKHIKSHDDSERFRFVMSSTDKIFDEFAIYIKKITASNVESLKSWLKQQYDAGTPVTVYYPLAEPTEESIELPDIPTLDGTTIIETDTEIPASNIEATYKARR